MFLNKIGAGSAKEIPSRYGKITENNFLADCENAQVIAGKKALNKATALHNNGAMRKLLNGYIK